MRETIKIPSHIQYVYFSQQEADLNKTCVDVEYSSLYRNVPI